MCTVTCKSNKVVCLKKVTSGLTVETYTIRKLTTACNLDRNCRDRIDVCCRVLVKHHNGKQTLNTVKKANLLMV